MRNPRLSLPLQEPTFARPITPGCPTDSGIEALTSVLQPGYLHPTKSTGIPRSSSLTRNLPAGPRTANPVTRSSSLSRSDFNNPPGTQWRIPPGSYVAFSLDTKSIAGNLFPVGSDGYEAILNYPVGKYTGLVVTSYTFAEGDEDAPVEHLAVHYVGSMPPPVNTMQDHILHISPSTNRVDPAGHTPLQTTPFFPWKDKYQWTTSGTRLSVTTLHDSRLRFALEDDEFSRLEYCAERDYDALRDSECSGIILADDDLLDQEWEQEEDRSRLRWTVGSLKVPGPDYALPAVVWRDIRDAGHDPVRFVREIDDLVCIVERFTSTRCQDDDPEMSESELDTTAVCDGMVTDTDIDTEAEDMVEIEKMLT